MKTPFKALLLASSLAGAGTHAEVVVIVSAKHAAASMTSAQVADIFLGKDTSVSPIDLPDAAAQRSEFYRKVAGKDAAQVKAIWTRLVFTGKSQPPKEAVDSADAVKAVATNERAIAYVDKAAVDGSVKVVFTVN